MALNRIFWKKLHLWLAMLAALPLLVTAATGILLAYQPWLEAWLEPDYFAIEGANSQTPLSSVELITLVKQYRRGVTVHHVSLPDAGSNRPAVAFVSVPSANENEQRQRFTLFVNPYTGNVSRRQEGGPVKFIEQLHRNLTLGKPGRYIVGSASIILMISSLVGVYLWLPMRNNTFQRFRRCKDALSWHNLSGLIVLPLIFLLAFTGVTLTFNAQVMPAVHWLTLSKPLPEPPTLATNRSESPLSFAELFLLAQERFSDARITAASEAENTKPMQIWLRRDGDMHPNGWERVHLDPYTGATLMHVDTFSHSPASAYQRSWYVWHIGAILGTPGRVLWSLACGLILVSGGAGFLLWWRRAQAKRQRRQRTGQLGVSKIESQL